MKRLINTILFVLIALNITLAQTKETNDYVEFDDRKNIVHGVYLGVSQHFGRISNENAGFTSLKVAYVANRKFEIGFEGTLFYSSQPNNTGVYKGNDILLFGGYGGLHLEPILFGNRFISVSFPLLIGGGTATILERKENGNFEFIEEDFENNKYDFDSFFIVEPGINILYNISRYVQIETGVRYRISESFKLPFYGKDNIKGFSAGLGIKIGVFNIGRKKKIKDDFN
jgi:hypothetical protein